MTRSKSTKRSSASKKRKSKGVSFAEVSRIGRKLPSVAESTSYGTPALKVSGKLFARLREDGETLVLRCDFVSRDFMLRAEPELFYLTDHYRDYPWILLKLPEVTTSRLTELLEDSWRLAAPPRLRQTLDDN